MSLRPHVAVCTDEDHGEMNFIYWLKIHISEGLRFSLIMELTYLKFVRYGLHVQVPWAGGNLSMT